MVKAGYEVEWKKEKLTVTKDGISLPVEVRSGTSVLPNEVCLELIEDIERVKRIKVKTMKTESTEEEFQLKSIWPQLTNVINWLLKNQFERAVKLMRLVICRRRKEIEDEEAKVEEQMKLMREQVKGRKEAEIKKVLGQEIKLVSLFKETGGEPVKLDLAKRDVSKDYTVEAFKRTMIRNRALEGT